MNALVTPRQHALPMALKVAFTAFMAVLVPVYWTHYGPTNFLYFCDLALFLTLVALWTEHPLPAGMAAVGIVGLQLIWCADFAVHFAGFRLTGATDYMFKAENPLYLRAISLFHGWLPFLLLFMVRRLGYHRRSLLGWTLLAWAAMLVAYFFLPPAGAKLQDPLTPVNINYVFGLGDEAPQTLMSQRAWLLFMLTALPGLIYVPSHFLLKRFAARPVQA